MRREELGDLAAFLAVAQEHSFTRAAAKLGTSQSALSHTVRRLEERLQVRLLTRTTRSVSTTEAGKRLLDTVGPAIDSIQQQLENLSEFRDRPSGTIRITTPDHAAQTILWPVVDRYLRQYPDVHIELDADTSLTDIVSERFDAGVRLGEQVANDMIAVRIGPQLRMAVIAAPAYFAAHGKPKTPHDLTSHKCINLRMRTSGGLYVWEFEKGGQELNVRVEGQITFNGAAPILQAVQAGHGIAYVMEDRAESLLDSGAAIRVLESWCPSFDGYHLYYPSRRQPTPAFSLLVEMLRFRAT